MSDLYESMKNGFVRDDLTLEQVAAQAAIVTPLTESVRDLIDAVIQSEVDDDELIAATKEIEAITARLRAKQIPGGYGVRISEGVGRSWGNPVVGKRNAMAPPITTVKEPGGLVWAETFLSPRFEGPAGMVHGGITSLLLDQMVGEAASAKGAPGMTGKLTLRYLRPTPLGHLRLEAEAEPAEGIKTLVKARTMVKRSPDADWDVCVEAEAIMILPRWARERLEAAEVAGDALPPSERAYPSNPFDPPLSASPENTENTGETA